jgi:Cu/Ag efflux protein CusF
VRIQITWLAVALVFALPACSPPQPTAEAPPSAEQTAPSDPVRSRGVVYAVTREYNAITIQHEAIPEYEMAPMVMEFTVDNSSQLEGIEVGDTVTFELRSGLDIATIQEIDAN